MQILTECAPGLNRSISHAVQCMEMTMFLKWHVWFRENISKGSICLFILLGDVMAGTWAAILDSEVKTVSWGCQSRHIEENWCWQTQEATLLYAANLHTSFMGERNLIITQVLVWIPSCSQTHLILSDITSSNCSFHLALFHCIIAIRTKFTILPCIFLLRNPRY